MLTIINDPAGITGAQRHAWDFEATITDNVARYLSGGAECEVRLNGVVIDPLTDPRMDLPPSAFDQMTVMRRPAGIETLAWIIVAAVVAAAVAYSMMPDIPGAGSSTKESPNNRLTAQTNIARAYQAIPDVYGYRRVWPDLIQPSTVEYIGHVKYVTEWLCVSRGKGTITDVQYAETPIEDVSGASFEVFEPAGPDAYAERNTTTITDVLETFESPDVNGQELVYVGATQLDGDLATVSGANFSLMVPDGADIAWIKAIAGSGTAQVDFDFSGGTFSQVCDVNSVLDSGETLFISLTRASGTWGAVYEEPVTVTLTPTSADIASAGPFVLPVDCSRIRWSVVFLRGLRTDGDSVDIKAEWWKVDGAGVEIGGTREDQTYSYTGRTYDQQFFTEDVTPAAGLGRYRIQFTRLTGPIGDSGTDVAKLEEVYAVRHYATKALPGVTIIRVTTKATQEATGYSERKFNLRWQRHVRTLDSDTHSASRNFARAMLHAWTLAGYSPAGLDVAALAAINAEFGETSALLRFDSSLDDADMSLGERLQVMADTARCAVWRSGTKWTVTRDQARPYPVLQLDYRNLAAGGDSAISYAAHLPATYDAIELEYADPTSMASKAYVRLSIASGAVTVGTGANPRKIRMQGCVTTAQAENRAHLEARRLLYQRISVSDEALSDALTLGVMDQIRWIDPNDFAGDDGLQAGEVLAVEGSVVRTSEPLHWGAETTGRILFTGADGQHLGSPALCEPVAGDDRRVLVHSLPAGVYVADATRQCGSRYSFGVGLTESEMEAAGLYSVVSVKPKGNGEASIAFVNYDARMYEHD